MPCWAATWRTRVDQGRGDALAAQVGQDGDGLDPEHGPVDQIDAGGVKAGDLVMDRADGIIAQPGDDDFLVRPAPRHRCKVTPEGLQTFSAGWNRSGRSATCRAWTSEKSRK